jgi:hypothetical protein
MRKKQRPQGPIEDGRNSNSGIVIVLLMFVLFSVSISFLLIDQPIAYDTVIDRISVADRVPNGTIVTGTVANNTDFELTTVADSIDFELFLF